MNATQNATQHGDGRVEVRTSLVGALLRIRVVNPPGRAHAKQRGSVSFSAAALCSDFFFHDVRVKFCVTMRKKRNAAC